MRSRSPYANGKVTVSAAKAHDGNKELAPPAIAAAISFRRVRKVSEFMRALLTIVLEHPTNVFPKEGMSLEINPY